MKDDEGLTAADNSYLSAATLPLTTARNAADEGTSARSSGVRGGSSRDLR